MMDKNINPNKLLNVLASNKILNFIVKKKW